MAEAKTAGGALRAGDARGRRGAAAGAELRGRRHRHARRRGPAAWRWARRRCSSARASSSRATPRAARRRDRARDHALSGREDRGRGLARPGRAHARPRHGRACRRKSACRSAAGEGPPTRCGGSVPGERRARAVSTCASSTASSARPTGRSACREEVVRAPSTVRSASGCSSTTGRWASRARSRTARPSRTWRTCSSLQSHRGRGLACC